MNRHERRAAEARERQKFADYESTFRRAFRKADARAIGEGFMRGEAAEVNGIRELIMHPPGEPAPKREECEIELSATYGEQGFHALIRKQDFAVLKTEWPRLIATIRAQPKNRDKLDADERSNARQFLLETIVSNRQWQLPDGPLAAAAIVWLATTSPVGALIGEVHKHIHFEITDTPEGAAPRNFRMMLM